MPTINPSLGKLDAASKGHLIDLHGAVQAISAVYFATHFPNDLFYLLFINCWLKITIWKFKVP